MSVSKKQSTYKMAELGILLALVIVLQSLSGMGVVNICLCLVPITLGAMVLGPKYGAALGFAFGLVAIFWGLMGRDMFTYLLLQFNPVVTVLICIVKGSLAGLVPALFYKLIKKREFKGAGIVAAVVAGVSAPVVNTGIFAIGSMIIKNDVVSVCNELGLDTSGNFIALLFLTLIGINFFFELLINVVFSPALNRITLVLEKQTGIAAKQSTANEEKSTEEEKKADQVDEK
ncbi:MAG: ECF transporter S component [Clostridia bacterium]|nr:ECF transporter S component [Clostridia bacterium]